MNGALFQALGVQPWATRHSPFSQGELEGTDGEGHSGYSLWSPTKCRTPCPLIYPSQQHDDVSAARIPTS